MQKMPDYLSEPPERYYAVECPFYTLFREGLHKECVNCQHCENDTCIHPEAFFYGKGV